MDEDMHFEYCAHMSFSDC